MKFENVEAVCKACENAIFRIVRDENDIMVICSYCRTHWHTFAGLAEPAEAPSSSE